MLVEEELVGSSSRVSQSSGKVEVLLELRLRGGDSMDLVSVEKTVSTLGGLLALVAAANFSETPTRFSKA